MAKRKNDFWVVDEETGETIKVLPQGITEEQAQAAMERMRGYHPSRTLTLKDNRGTGGSGSSGARTPPKRRPYRMFSAWQTATTQGGLEAHVEMCQPSAEVEIKVGQLEEILAWLESHPDVRQVVLRSSDRAQVQLDEITHETSITN